MLSRVLLDALTVFAVLWGFYRRMVRRFPVQERYDVDLSSPEQAEFEIRQAIRRARMTCAPVHVRIYDCHEEIEAITERLAREYPHITTEQRHMDFKNE